MVVSMGDVCVDVSETQETCSREVERSIQWN